MLFCASVLAILFKIALAVRLDSSESFSALQVVRMSDPDLVDIALINSTLVAVSHNELSVFSFSSTQISKLVSHPIPESGEAFRRVASDGQIIAVNHRGESNSSHLFFP